MSEMVELDQIPEGECRSYEALIETGSFILGGQRAWVPITKLSPRARFPVVVNVPDVGSAKCEAHEILNVRRKVPV